MLPIFLQTNYLKHASRIFLFLVVTLVALPAFAVDNILQPGAISTLSAQDMLVNIARQIPQLMRLITAVSYVLGMYFIFSGILKLKHMGEMRTMMSREHSVMVPIIYLVVGAMLLYFPTSVQVGLSTFWTNPNPYAYVEQQDQWGQFLNDCFMIVQLVGTIAFIRGLVLLSHAGGHHGGGQGSFGKGITHIIGGIFCINIYQFVQVILVTLGIQT